MTNDITNTPYIDREKLQTEMEEWAMAFKTNRVAEALNRKIKAGEASEADGVKDAMPGVVVQITGFLREIVDAETAKTGRGRRVTWLSIMEALDLDALSYEAAHLAFSAAGALWTVRGLTQEIGETLFDHHALAQVLASEDKKAKKKVKKGVATRDTRRARRKVVRKEAVDLLKLEEWTDDFKSLVAQPVMNAILKTHLFQTYEDVPKKRKKAAAKGKQDDDYRERFFSFSNEGILLTKQAVDVAAAQRPLLTPMLCPPRPWRDFDTGAYQTDRIRRRVKLVRTRSKDGKARIKDALKSGKMDRFTHILNRTQAVGYQVNEVVLHAVQWAFSSGLKIKKFPRRDTVPVPELPENFDDLKPRDKAKLIRNIKRVKAVNRSIEAGAKTFRAEIGELDVDGNVAEMSLAEKLKASGAFFMPHNCDYRGRVYPVSPFSHHRADYIKSLFLFDKGKPLGRSGAKWLAIHLANVWGEDKAPLADRVRWVHENTDMILSIAEDWYEDQRWLEADKPFSFLAACHEWYGYVTEGEGYVCHLPVFIDGSNSGIQHLALAQRAEEGELVNLKPAERPMDGYRIIWEDVEPRLQAIAALPQPEDFDADLYLEKLAEARKEAEEAGVQPADCDRCKQLKLDLKPWAARVWLGWEGRGRGLVKRNVMTFGYGSEVSGYRDQIIEDHIAPVELEYLSGERPDFPFGADGGFFAAQTLAKEVYAAVTERLPKAHEAMVFYQQCAQLLAHEGKPLVWTTPLGFPVTHAYRQHELKRVEMYLYDRSVPVWEAASKDKVNEETGEVFKRYRTMVATAEKTEIVKRKQKSAAAPNVTHSMDSTHLMLAAGRFFDTGHNQLMLIHDSWGCLPADMEALNTQVRETLVKMYEDFDPLAAIREATLNNLEGDDLIAAVPELPAKGNLDISLLTKCVYSFA